MARNKGLDASLYMTEADGHHQSPLVAERLRGYIMQHGLFFNKLLVSDSAFNNNRALRQVVWDQETPAGLTGYPQDLFELTGAGLLVPAVRREYGNLTALRREHASRGVENVPPEEYTTLIDEKSKGSAEMFDLPMVAQAFRERVLEALDDPNNVGPGKISRQTRDLVKSYALGQDPLLFADLRAWMREQLQAERITERSYKILDRMMAEAYRYNVGIALNKNLDVSLSNRRDIYPISITLGSLPEQPRTKPASTQLEIRPTVYLAPRVLYRVPAQALLAVKQHSVYYRKVAEELEIFRTTRAVNIETFAGDLERYLADVEMTFNDFLTNRQRSDIIEIKKHEKGRALVKGIFDIGLSILSFVPFAHYIPAVVNAVGLISAAYGTVTDIRAAARQEDRIQGYILGRSDSLEKLYALEK